MNENLGTKIATINHFFDHIGVAAMKLDGDLKVGDNIRVKGATTDFTQTVAGLQSDHVDLPAAHAGQEVGLKMDDKVREGDGIYLVNA